ncbi:uncharacterized protein aunip [Neosynchiropus ocellatus]
MACKPVRQTPSQDECGVWLDTVQLKDKAKQKKRPMRPISKLLNPLLNGGGYSLAVALNFTQTKIEMPKTKQTSMSNFFEPQRRKFPDHLRKEAHRDSKRSPIKKPSTHHEEDSLSMLFTQDSEGFRVIAHRGHQTQLSPLKHKMRIIKNKIVSESQIEEEEENPFTQDSQGNVVIKHL